MEFEHRYAGSSGVAQSDAGTAMSFAPDTLRAPVFFRGVVTKQVEFREAISALHDVVTSDLRVKIDATGLYTYPDVVIYCDRPQFDDNVHDTLLNPRTIVEVLSDSTEKYDRGTKFTHYRQVASLRTATPAAFRTISAAENPRPIVGSI